MTIIAVDDNETHCYALGHVLRSAGYSVFEAHTGAAALKMVEQHSPELVLLDTYLPDATGYELLKILRRNPRTQAVGVVMYTASEPTSEGKGIAESLGADGFLTYPITPGDLLITVQGVMVKAKLRGAK